MKLKTFMSCLLLFTITMVICSASVVDRQKDAKPPCTIEMQKHCTAIVNSESIEFACLRCSTDELPVNLAYSEPAKEHFAIIKKVTIYKLGQK